MPALRRGRFFALASALLAFGCSADPRDRGGNLAAGGASGTPTGTTGSGGGGPVISLPDAAADVMTRVSDSAGILNDAVPEVGISACVADGAAAGPGPYVRRCAAATDNECDGATEVDPQRKNGAFGNGFDDDCDGKVDEGCACDAAHPVGTTKPCSLVSPTQVDPATNKPVGWCAINSMGTEKCITKGNEVLTAVWDGECRGAQPPFADDVCAPGDFDCDGRDLNSKTRDCRCRVDVKCPTDPIVTAPFPDPNNLPPIDGSSWVGGGPGNGTNWKWTVTGGDCDNILPHPTFAVYGQPQATLHGPRLSGNTPQTGLGTNGNQKGFVIGPGPAVGSTIYPAFGLSGDYLVKGEWDSPDGHHACTVKVQVRAPGIRVELCWAPQPQDVDLHFARLQNPKSCTHGWFTTCAADETGDDCYFSEASGCRGVDTGATWWGYPNSPDAACHGWASKRQADCNNPRLDVDNLNCDPNVADPMNDETTGGFCGPENINLDNPKNGDKFVVGAHFFSKLYDAITPPPPKPHVNIYCNGERKLAFGYDPTSTPPNEFPVLRQPGSELVAIDTGDMWEVARIEAKVTGGALTDCLITPIHSKTPKPTKDGSTDICVDTNPQNNPGLADPTKWNFMASGGYPATADAFCWH
jgi:hypothetical protein